MSKSGRIPHELIDQIRERADLVGIVGEMVQLKKAGREFKGLCPFHQEKTPSFYVIPAKGFYQCFGCSKSGDVFNFVMEQRGMDFVEAVEYVAGRTGIEIVREEGKEDPNRPLYEIVGFARSWFRERLLDEVDGAEARAYLEGRGIGMEVAERFGLGWAPDEWRALREAAQKHGLDEDLMLHLGLLKKSERSKEPYDGYRGRIIFPIESASGQTIAFGGRNLTGDIPKYINSPESDIYTKGQHLYGLSWAKNAIRKEDAVVLVEGYMDVVALAAAGFENVVAALGTALTSEQAERLAGYTKQPLLLFDSDSGGQKATFKGGDILLAAGMHPKVVTLPSGEDPDTLVRDQGAEALRELMSRPLDVLDRKIQLLEEANYFTTIDRKHAAVDKLMPTLEAVRDPARRDLYIGRVAEVTGVRRETLEGAIEESRTAARKTHSETGGGSFRRQQQSTIDRRRQSTHGSFERMGPEPTLLKVMLRGVSWVERAVEVGVGAEDFEDPYYRAIFEALLDEPELREPPESMDPLARERFDEVLDPDEDLKHGSELFTDSVTRLRVRALVRREQELQAAIERTSDIEEKMRLLAEKSTVKTELLELDSTYGWGSVTHRDPTTS